MLNSVSAYQEFLNDGDVGVTNTGKENFIWSSGIISEDSERNTSSIASPTIYTNGNISRQGITRWDFEDENEAAKSGFPAVQSEMADEFSSGPEEIETQNGSSWCRK